MQPKNTPRWLAPLLALAVATTPAAAQVTPPPVDPVVSLSPFVVNSTKDNGYQATSTLAGTRLNTDLQDLGASISIYTKDFLEDIGATNTADLLIYATGMEAAGPGGNYSATADNAVASAVSTNGYREDPDSTNRARGLASPTKTRDFFNTFISIDSYNTERLTMVRGPNSALIGVGSPAGTVDTSLARADLRRNRNSISARIDDNGGLRSIADFSRVLVPNKLAARLIGLDSREEYDQRPAYQHKRRLYGTLTFEPFRNTTIRGNFETGNMRANQPINILLQNSIADEWYAAGRPSFDWTYYDDPARNPLAASQSATNFLPFYMGLTPGIYSGIYNNPNDTRPAFVIQNTFPSTTATAANAIRSGTFHPQLNRDLATDSGRFVSTLNIQEIAPAAYWTGARVLPGNLPGMQPPGLRIQGFTDFSAFDWKNRLIDESSFFTSDFHAANFSIAQTAWQNRIGIELAYDQQRQDNRAMAAFVNGNGARQTMVRIDTSVTLPDGTPNPNLGRPFLQAENFRIQKRFNQAEAARATAYLQYDFKDLPTTWGKWLGSHTLGGVAERYRMDEIVLVTRVRFDGPAMRTLVNNINSANASFNVYLGPSLIGNNNPLKLEAIKIPRVEMGPYDNISTFVREAGTTDAGRYVQSPLSIVPVVQPGRGTREVIESQSFTLQSHWLDRHVMTVVGWRKDVDYNEGSINIGFPNHPKGTGPFDPGPAEIGFDDFDFPGTPAELDRAETRTYSVVLKWPNKLLRLPAGSDLRLFYNNSENFTPSGKRTDPYGEPLPSPKGKTKEYGFNLSVLNNKLVLRGNIFETSNQFVGFSGTTGDGGPRLVVDAVANWMEEANVNPHLVPARNADIQRLLSAVPPGLLELYQLQVSGTAPNIVVTNLSSPPTGGTTTSDLSGKGVELELVYNPTSNWRILANVARQQTTRSNISPFMKKFAADLAPVFAELADRPYGNYPIGHQLGQPLPANVQTVGQRVDQRLTTPLAADLASEGLPSAEQRKWRVNFVTSYRFGSGSILGDRLKGWSVGGGLRWQSKFAIGYPATRQPNGVPIYDMANPWYAPDDLNIDAFIAYQRRIWNDRVTWKMQLNATNIYQQRELIPVNAQPWGEVATMRLAPEQRWFLTNTFSF